MDFGFEHGDPDTESMVAGLRALAANVYRAAAWVEERAAEDELPDMTDWSIVKVLDELMQRTMVADWSDDARATAFVAAGHREIIRRTRH